MADMPRPRLPHTHVERTRHGKTVWYHRIGQGPRTRLRAPYGTPEFNEEYRAAELGEPLGERQMPVKQAGSMAWAIGLYKQSSAWQGLSEATKRQRSNILKHVEKEGGDIPLKAFGAKNVKASYERRAATPAAARNFLETMRGLFKWAHEADLIRENPTEGVKSRRIKSEGFPIWTEEEVARFQAHWPVGTRPRVAFDLLLYTGLRRGDAAKLGRPHVRDGVARIQTEKTGTWVAIRLEQELLATLVAGPCGELTFICGEGSRPLTKESFGNYFREWCREAGLSKSAHGLRKMAATRAAERGYSNFEMDATFGWQGGGMADLYTRKINREKLSLNAAERVRRVK